MSYFYLDLETVPDVGKMSYILPEVDEIYLPKPDEIANMNANDARALIKQYELSMGDGLIAAIIDAEAAGKDRITVQSALSDALDSRYSAITRAALDPELCKIAAVGCALGDGDIISVSIQSQDIECNAIELLWSHIESMAKVVGYNIIGFDIPVLCARSMMLGLDRGNQLPVDLRKYGNPKFVDLMVARFPFGKAKSMHDMAELYGIEIPEPGLDGSMVYDMDDEEVIRHVRSDVFVTRELHKRMTGYFV